MVNNKVLSYSLILIGGGIMRKGETEKIDQWMLEVVKKKRKINTPRVLFVPSSSGDLKEYVQDFTRRYQNYGAMVSSIFLVKDSPLQEEVENSFLNADLVYFGGGDTDLLLGTFRKFNLESICIKAIQKGAVISGLSAGAIIWGEKFLTFDRRGDKFVNFRIENGLGWIDELIIPHFHPLFLKKKVVLRLLKQNINFKTLVLGDGVAAYWENKPSPLFKKQKETGIGISISVRELIRKL